MSNKAFFHVDDLSKRFGGIVATDHVSIQVDKNQIYGIIGPNGAGKTTLFNMISGVYAPIGGHIYLDGVQLDGLPMHKIAQIGVARTFQNIRLFSDLTCYENLLASCQKNIQYRFFDGIFRTPKCRREERQLEGQCREYLREVGLETQAEQLARNLPYGMQRRLEIARAMITSPKLLLLDEPAAGMHPDETQEFMDMIRFVRDEFDMTILLIEHDMKLVSGICEELTVLNFGQVLAQGKTSNVLNDPEVIKAYLGE